MVTVGVPPSTGMVSEYARGRNHDGRHAHRQETGHREGNAFNQT
jgi:hypothetical protein